ncbi:MAG: hypothetical protein NUV80_05070 [Candidatus Berkelbacteria bacterium]|nr:hypothetical protein [Candidatus Berkelbacteria bacterium]MCR4307909.1 hypothetical protein [Candidatus Berkelbacteria bacterium]
MQLNEVHTEHEHATTSLKVVLLVFAIVLVGALSYLVWAANTAPDTTDNSAATTQKTTATTPSTTSTVPSTTKTDSTDSWKTYSNSDYGFTLTLGDLWKGYKVKKAAPPDITGNVAVYSFTMPSTGNDASPINDAGYREVFSVKVFTPSQYANTPDGVRGVQLGSNSSYVYTYSTTQDAFEGQAAAVADIKNVVATFKLTP